MRLADTLVYFFFAFLPHDCSLRLPLYVCLSVRPSFIRLSVTFVYCVKTSKDILKQYKLTILVFPIQALWKHSAGDTPTGAKSDL